MQQLVNWDWIGKGWKFYREDFWNIFLLCVIANAVIWIITAATYGVVGIIIAGPIYCGIYKTLFNRMTEGGKTNIGMLMDGFQQFIPSLIASLLIKIFVLIGGLFLIIPGLILASCYMFTFPIITDKRLNFWDAMEKSRKLVFKDLFMFFIFYIVLLLIAFSGVIICGIGIFLTLPLYFCITAVAYKELSNRMME